MANQSPLWYSSGCLSLALVVLPGCEGESDSLAASRIDTLPGGVVQVTNTGPSGWQDSSGWKLVLERTIAPADGSPAELIRPWSMAADADGTLYLMDLQPPQVKVFGAEGGFSHLIGREGDGPAEYRGVGLHLVGDTLLVHDPTNSRVVRFHVDGSPLGEWPVRDSRRHAAPTRQDGAVPVEIIFRDLPASEEAYFARRGFQFMRTDGTVLDTVRLPPEPKPAMWELRDERNDFGTFVPFAPWQEAILTSAGTVVWGHQGEYRLILSRNGIDTMMVITAPGQVTAIPDSLREREFAEAVKREAWIADKGRLADIPTVYPVWLNLASDPTGHIWVQRASGSGYVADVFTPSGILLGSVPAPFEFHPRDHWTSDRVFHPTTDDEGFPVVEVYRIVRNLP